VTHDPLTHLNRDPPLVTHDPSQLLLHTGTHTIKSSHADVFMTALAWPDLNTFHYKILGSESITKAQDVNDLSRNLFDE